jgi:hypothetical protein
VAPALEKSEAAVKSAFLSLIGRQEDDIDVEQLYLPLRQGGLGLQRMPVFDGVVCRAGYLAAASLAQAALADGAQGFQPLGAAGDEDLAACWLQLTAFSNEGEGPHLKASTIQDAHSAGELQQLQRSIGGAVQAELHSLLLGKYEAQLSSEATRVQAQEHLARLHSLQQGVGTCWLDVRPTKDQWELDDATVKSALRFMLGVSPGPAHQAFFQCSCGYKGSDSHHAMTCDKLAGPRILRHTQIQSMVQCGAAAAGHSSSIEPQERHLKGLCYGDDGYGKRGDVLVSSLDDLLNVDITVTHPASYSMRSRASKEPGAAARVAEENKRRVHGANTSGHTFVPFAIESYGRLGRAAVQLLNDWADAVAGDVFFDRASYLVWMKRELSVALIKGNARMFRRYVGMLTQGVGQRFVAGGALLDID